MLRYIVYVLTVVSTFQQQLPKQQQEENLRAQASQMLQALGSYNAAEYVSFLYLPYIKEKGGEDSLIRFILNDGKKRTVGTITVTILDTVLPMYIFNGELQSIVHAKIEDRHGTKHSTSSWGVIALSDDAGRTWKFIPSYEYYLRKDSSLPSLGAEIEKQLYKDWK